MQSARVGPYFIERPLGVGGMAETFVAVRRGPAGFEQRVCLKRILPGRAADPRFVELFLDEARLLARLRNTAIVQVYDFGEAEDTYYMALELVDGMDLDALLQALKARGRRMPWKLALHVAVQVLSALHYAFGLDVDGQPLRLVHRDISPSNVLLSIQGEAKLSDFGIAKAHGRQHKTATGFTKGKVAYMSPEQVRGEELDCRSDLFAVGIVLYEMLAGAHPFDAPTDFVLLNNILGGNAAPLTQYAEDVPPAIVELTHRLLATSPADRPATPGEALLAITLHEPPFVMQTQLAALVTELRPVRAAAPATGGASANDGRTQVLPPAQPGSGDYGTPANGTAEMSMGARRSARRTLLVSTLGLALVAGGAGLWWSNARTAELAPQPPHTSSAQQPARDTQSAPAPTEQPTDARAATAPRPTPQSVPVEDAAEPPTGLPGSNDVVLHEPENAPPARARREPKPPAVKPAVERAPASPASPPRKGKPGRSVDRLDTKDF